MHRSRARLARVFTRKVPNGRTGGLWILQKDNLAVGQAGRRASGQQSRKLFINKRVGCKSMLTTACTDNELRNAFSRAMGDG